MTNYKNLASLRKYVKYKKRKEIKALRKVSLEWLKIAAKNRLTYEIDWLGVPVIQTPEELVLMQELIFEIQPDYIIESGIAHGGGLIFYASILELLNKGKVVGIDIDIRDHNKKVLKLHPLFKRIKLIEDSSVSKKVIQQLKKIIPATAKVIVCLDSDHSKAHVFKELMLYQQFIKKGGYLVVFDTFSSLMAKKGIADKKYINNGPLEAIKDFLKINKNFIIDRKFNKLFISYSQDGYLKRIK